MTKYLARINLSYPYAEEQMKELGGFWGCFVEKIPQAFKAEMLLYRFTFASVQMMADNVTMCREVIKSAWRQAFGSEEGISEILVCEFEDEVASDLIKSIYDGLYGVEDYQRLITEMTGSIPLLRERDAMDLLRKQSYLFAIDDGCGFSTLISSLGDYLHRMGIFTEKGDGVRERYLEVIMGKESENGLISQDDFIDMLIDVDEDANPYNIVALDVSYFLEGKRYDELRKFLKRLERYQEQFVFAFRIPFLEKKAFDDVKDLFTDQLLIRTIQIPPLADCVLMEMAWNVINDKKFVPNVSLLELIAEKLHQEKMDGRFYGFKTLVKIAHEMILRKSADYAEKRAKGLEADSQNLVAEDVQDLLEKKKEQVTGYAALEELIGMEEITAKVREIIAQVKISMENEKLDRPCIHMRFTGSPGTGKTTVARIIGQIMREEGILRKGGFFEYTGRDLVAEYVGQTAVKTATICRDSYGSVLFIDEAYALYDGDHNTNDFGKEALTTLISEMENHRDDMLVVMAGYSDEMDTLMTANPGLRSRMPRVLHFPNYSREQLFEIFMLMVRKHFDYQPELETEAKEYFSGLSQAYLDSKEFANARFVRNLYERTWSKAALRSSLAGIRTIELTKEDFIAARGEKEFSEKIERRKVLGF